MPAYFDADRVLQVITNLIANAVKFTPAGGTIHVSAEAQEHCVEFSVRDTGAGIPPDLLEVIFERFRQGRSKTVAGSGEAQQGRIWAESEIGRGTTFRFTLPRTAVVETGTSLTAGR